MYLTISTYFSHNFFGWGLVFYFLSLYILFHNWHLNKRSHHVWDDLFTVNCVPTQRSYIHLYTLNQFQSVIETHNVLEFFVSALINFVVENWIANLRLKFSGENNWSINGIQIWVFCDFLVDWNRLNSNNNNKKNINQVNMNQSRCSRSWKFWRRSWNWFCHHSYINCNDLTKSWTNVYASRRSVEQETKKKNQKKKT